VDFPIHDERKSDVGGDRSNGYVVRTADGGATWSTQRPITDATSDVFFVGTNGWLKAYELLYKVDPWGNQSGYWSPLISKTTDGGATWSTPFTPNTPDNYEGNPHDFSEIFFINANTGWAIYNGQRYIFRTDDGGANWSLQNNFAYESSGHDSKTFYDIFFIDANNGWASGSGYNYGAIYKTTNGGGTWYRVETPAQYTETFYGVFFVDSNTGWAVGYGPTSSTSGVTGSKVYKTTNGGWSWTMQTAGSNLQRHVFHDVFFADANTGWVVGNDYTNGVIYNTTNGGASWSLQKKITDNGSYLRAVSFSDDKTGWAVGDGTPLKTTDGGLTWLEQNGGTNGDWYAVCASPTKEVTIDIISPNFGPTLGGTVVTITGENFGSVQGPGTLTFGGVEATITSWSNTEIVCATPEHVVGAVDVSVQTTIRWVIEEYTSTGTKSGGYTYQGASIETISPNFGPTTGGTVVTLTGVEFDNIQGNGFVTFDGVEAIINNWSDTEIVCVAPEHSVDVATVAVTNNDTETGITAQFSYLHPSTRTDVAYALYLDGTDDYVSMDAVADDMAGQQENFTFSAWVRTNNTCTATTRGAIFGVNGSGSEDLFLIQVGDDIAGDSGDNKVSLLEGGAYEITGSVVGNLGWHHVAYVRDSTTGTLYLDGINQGTHTADFTLASTDRWSIGQEWDDTSPSDFLDGQLDEIRIWNVARTQAEIRADMYQTLGAETNLTAYYKMSDGYGTQITDDSGNSNHAILHGSRFAYISYTLDFDGIDDYVDLGRATDFDNLGQGDFTFEMWIKTNDMDSKNILLGNYGDSGDPAIGFELRSGKLSAWLNGEEHNDDANVADGAWHHIAMVYAQGSTVKIYIDSVEAYSGSSSQASFTCIDNLMLARDPGTSSYYYSGTIDEVRIWNVARTQTDIRTYMYHTINGSVSATYRVLAGNEANLVAYYQMSDGYGTTLTDDSGNSHSGTLHGVNWGYAEWYLNITPPDITSINPGWGYATGGTVVTITGSGFGIAQGTSGTVTFGGVETTNYTNWWNTEIVCTAPEQTTGGAMDVVVTTDYSVSNTEYSGFRYVEPLKIITRTSEPRWRIVGAVITPTNSDGDSLFDSWGLLLEDWTVARWNPVEERYERPKGLTQTGAGKSLPESNDYFVPGTGWWIAKNSDGLNEGEIYNWHIPGNPVTTDTNGNYTHTITVYEGWNIIANPFYFNRAWNNDGITLTYTKGGQTYTQAIADAAQCTDSKIYWFNGANDSYPSGISYTNGHVMGPWYGYWIKIEEGVTNATLNITSKATSGSAPVYPASTTSIIVFDWQINITATIEGDDKPSTIIVGISEQAKAGADLLDDRLPPPSLNGESVKFNFAHSDWPLWAGEYRSDIRPVSNSMVFPINLTVMKFGRAVILNFDFETVPDDYRIWLYNKDTREHIQFPRNIQRSFELEFLPTTPSAAFDLIVSNLPDGDMNGDKNVTQADANAILRAVVGTTELRTEQRILGDITGDGRISAYDAAVLLMYTTGTTQK